MEFLIFFVKVRFQLNRSSKSTRDLLAVHSVFLEARNVAKSVAINTSTFAPFPTSNKEIQGKATSQTKKKVRNRLDHWESTVQAKCTMMAFWEKISVYVAFTNTPHRSRLSWSFWSYWSFWELRPSTNNLATVGTFTSCTVPIFPKPISVISTVYDMAAAEV